ncbi:MAG: hypothetical protein H6R10_733 [Rhodocyclaceae bacterium]|nr:hypothetical protein [Rhodocyclaceae bacterium]
MTAKTLELSVQLVAPSPTNPRKNFPEEAQADLVASIQRHGVLQPILVRPWPEKYPRPNQRTTRYELVAGERRWRATVAAGLDDIPAMVRELTDLEVLEIQIIENLQRQDLHPLEEAEGYERMMKEHGYTADQLAEKIGKSKAYIYARLKLTALGEEGRRLFYAGLLTPSTALLVARIPGKKLQEKALKDITAKDYNEDVMSVRRAKRHIQDRYMLDLTRAPFPADDDRLAPGPCTTCPNRAGNQPEVFDDIGADVCTDPDCHLKKKQAYIEIQRQAAEAKGATVITGKEAAKIAPYGVQYHDPKGYKRLDMTCYEDPERRTYREILGDAAPTAVLIEDKSSGSLVEVVPENTLAEKLKAAGIEPRHHDHEAELQAMEAKVERERAFRLELMTDIRRRLQQEIHHGGPQFEHHELGLIASHLFAQGTSWGARGQVARIWGAEGAEDRDRIKAFTEYIEQRPAEELALLILDCILVGDLDVDRWSLDKEPKALLKLAKCKGIDVERLRNRLDADGSGNAEADTTAGESETPAEESGSAASMKQAAEVQPNTATPAALEFKKGDRVRVKECLKGPGGHFRKCCGREGVIEAITSAGDCSVKYGPKKADTVICKLDELEPLPPAHSEGTPTPTEAGAGGGTEAAKKAAPAGKKSTVREVPYAHPENLDLTWSGRGKQPRWVVEFLARDGNTLAMLTRVKGDIETNEKPAEAETPTFREDNLVLPGLGIEMNETPIAAGAPTATEPTIDEQRGEKQ